jgi:hypothetical protein
MSAFVGLDVHSDHTFATVINEDGKIVCKKMMANDQARATKLRTITDS